MSWGDWIDAESSEKQWKSAAVGLSEVFTTPIRQVDRPHAYLKGRALWVEVREPRDGIRLVAFSMARQGNTLGNIALRIWASDAPESMYGLFDSGPRFELQGRAWARHLNLAPSSSWEKQLRAKGNAVRGLWYSANLSDFGGPENAKAVLRTVFVAFCEFVAERYEKGPTKREAMVDEAPAATVEPHQDRQISELVDRLVDIGDSERDAIVKARIGQSRFRDRLLSRWGDACSVTGLKSKEVLIASHIVPWSRCTTASERWDVDNGLMLTPGLDKAFELGYIGFQHEGKERGRIVISPTANWDTRRRLGFDDPLLRIRDWHEGLAHYLERHRAWWQLS